MESTEVVTLKRSLRTRDLVIYGLIFMIPVCPIATYATYLVPANGMVALCYLIGMIAMSMTGLSYKKMAEQYPYAGSVYVYVQKGANPSLGFLAGWSILLDYFLLPVTVVIVGSSFANSLIPAIPLVAWKIFFIVLSTIVNILGVDIMAKFSWLLFAFQMIIIVLFVGSTLKMIFNGTLQWNTVAFFNANDFDLSGVFQATGIVILSYLGFDAIGTLAEETLEPRKSVGKAIMISIMIIGTLFIIVSFFAGVAYPDYQSLQGESPFLTIIQFVGGNWLVMLTVIVVVLSFGIATCQESHTAISRILFSMGRDGILPSKLAYLHPKFNTPVISVIVVALVVTPVSLVFSLESISLLVSFGALISFALLNLTVIWKFFIQSKEKKSGKNIVRYFLCPMIGTLINCWILYNLGITSHVIGFLWILIGFLYLVYMTRGFKKPVPQFDMG